MDFIDRRFEQLRGGYERMLVSSLNFIPVTVVFALIILSSIYFLYSSAKSELAPPEDQGFIINQATPAPNATLEQKQLYAKQIYQYLSAYPDDYIVFQIVTPGPFLTGMVLKPWAARNRTTEVLQPLVQADLDKVTGAKAVAFQPSPLPGGQGLPLQFVIGTAQPFAQLETVSEKFLQAARQSGMFIFIDTDLRIDQPQSSVNIDRDKTAALGLKMSDVGTAMATMLGGGYLNYFSLDGRSYRVIPQVQQRYRLNADQLLDYYIPTAGGTPVSLSTIATVTTKTVPESLNHFQQLNEATISGVTVPGVALGDAIKYLQGLAAQTLPQGYPDRLRRACRVNIPRNPTRSSRPSVSR